MGFFTGILIGGLVGIILVPIGFYVLWKVTEAKVRREIKRMILLNKFLIPIDKRDYDVKMWKDKINPDDYKEQLSELNDRIFKKGKYKPKEEDEQGATQGPVEGN